MKIEELTAKSGKLGVEIKNLEKEVAKHQAALDKATEIRRNWQNSTMRRRTCSDKQNAYDQVTAAKNAEIQAGQNQIDKKTEELTHTDEANAAAKQDLKDAKDLKNPLSLPSLRPREGNGGGQD